jgi:hypothetical protein
MTRPTITDLGSGLAVGIAIGVALGIAIDNLAVGIALGVAFGFGLGYFMETARNRKIKIESKESPSTDNKSPITVFLIVGLLILAVGLYILSKLRPLLF